MSQWNTEDQKSKSFQQKLCRKSKSTKTVNRPQSPGAEEAEGKVRARQRSGSSLKRADRPQSTAKGKGQGQAEADYQRSAKPRALTEAREQSSPNTRRYRQTSGRVESSITHRSEKTKDNKARHNKTRVQAKEKLVNARAGKELQRPDS